MVEKSYFIREGGAEGPCLNFWLKSSNFLAARLISDLFS